MSDLSKLDIPLPTAHERAWDDILRRWKRKERITKAEVEKLLTAGSVPECANGFLTAIVNGEDIFGRGNTPQYPRDMVRSAGFVAPLVKMVEAYIRNPESAPEDFDQAERQYYAELHKKAFHRRSGHARDHKSAGRLARDHVASVLDISESRVRKLITEYNKKRALR